MKNIVKKSLAIAALVGVFGVAVASPAEAYWVRGGYGYYGGYHGWYHPYYRAYYGYPNYYYPPAYYPAAPVVVAPQPVAYAPYWGVPVGLNVGFHIR